MLSPMYQLEMKPVWSSSINDSSTLLILLAIQENPILRYHDLFFQLTSFSVDIHLKNTSGVSLHGELAVSDNK